MSVILFASALQIHYQIKFEWLSKVFHVVHAMSIECEHNRLKRFIQQGQGSGCGVWKGMKWRETNQKKAPTQVGPRVYCPNRVPNQIFTVLIHKIWMISYWKSLLLIVAK
jgi:hypothetical protein